MRNDYKVGEFLKKNSFFIILFVALIGMMASGIQLLTNRHLLAMLLFGIVIVYLSVQIREKTRPLSLFGLFVGSILIVLAGLSTFGIWLSFFAVVLLALVGARKISLFNFWNDENWFWKKKSYVSVKVSEPKRPHQNERYNWIGTQQIGQDTFEWDDINIGQLAGDTIIDLCNTILPQQENIIVIRKGIGRVRILVPYGVGVKIHHHAFFGELHFQEKSLELKNEAVKLYSDNYESSTKSIKIISTMMLGTVEVIEV